MKKIKVKTPKKRSAIEIAMIVIAVTILLAFIGASGAFIVDKWGKPDNTIMEGRALRETLMSTNGTWLTFDKYGLDVRMPTDLESEKPTVGENYSKLNVTRDKGGTPEVAIGSIVIPDVVNRSLSVSSDLKPIIESVQPHLLEAIGGLYKGRHPTFTIDASKIVLDNGLEAMEMSGEAQVEVLYQDPKDKDNIWSETVISNFYSISIIHDGRPFTAWGVWDTSEYLGKETVYANTKDIIFSIMNKDGSVVLPERTETTLPDNIVSENAYPEDNTNTEEHSEKELSDTAQE